METAETAPQAAPDERLVRVGLATRVFRRPEIGSLVGVVAVFVVFTSTATGFATLDGFARWSDEASNLGLMAVVVSLLMIGGEFDLSAGVIVGSSGLLLGLLVTRVGLNVWPAIVLVLLFGAFIGLVNGVLVTRTRLPSFIVTLATFFCLQGLNLGGTLAITGAVYVSDIDSGGGYAWARKLLASTVWAPYGFAVRVFWWLALLAIATWVLTRSRVGNWIYAAGGDATAARAVGVPVMRTKVGLFMATSITGSLLGVMTAIGLRSVQASQGVGREFYYIIAAVVGGCLLTGGYGSAIGGALGALVIAMAEIGIPYSGWDSDWSFLFLGVILLFAVLLNTAIRRRAEAAGARE